MKKLYFTLLTCLVITSGLFSQSWQTVGSGFLTSGDIATNLQVLSFQDTAFVAYADMDIVKLKKRSGNNWLTIVNQNTENNYFKLIYGTNNKPYFITLSRGASLESVGSTGFFADIHEYDNGALTLVEAREMMFVPSGTSMSLDVTNFDFAMRPNGDMAGIIRYPSAARSEYNVKIGGNPWFSETVFYEAIGGTAGNAIERSKLTFFDEGVIIASKWIGGSSGVIHLFRHDNNSSNPILTAFDNASAGLGFSVGAGVDPLKITAKNDTVFLSHRNGANDRIFRTIYYDQTTIPVIGTNVLQTYPSNTFGLAPVFTNSNNYMIYIEEDQTTFSLTGYITDLPANYALANGQLLGGTQFTLGEQVVGPEVMSVDPSNGEVYVAYIHGPPMTQSIVRKFGCLDAIAALDAMDNELYVSSVHAPTATYEWTECGSSNVLNTFTSFVPAESGNYQFTVYDGLCASTSNCVNFTANTDNSSTINFEKSIGIYPNPANDAFVFTTSQVGGELTIIELTGKILYQTTIDEVNTNVSCSTFGKGMYIITYNYNGEFTNTRIILE